MSTRESFVIIGAGLTGAKAAETLRGEGFEGHVTLIGEEPWIPYERPPLSKGFLLGKEPQEKAYVHPEGWEEEHGIDLLLGTTVLSVDRPARDVVLHEGARVRYDKLLLATGAAPRRLDIAGTELHGVHYLRTLADSLSLREAISAGGRRVVVIGAGWIGLECAAAAREYGNEVTIVEPLATPLQRAIGPELGEIFGNLHRKHGCELLTSEGAAAIRGSGGRVTHVVTASGRELQADLVVIGVGAVPNVGTAIDAGLEVENGVLVDSALCTSDADIFANMDHPLYGRRIRVEHWANALNGGPAAARSMLGHQVVYDRVPYFFTDQYELGMEFSGLADAGTYDEVVFRGSVDSLEFIAFWLSAGRVVAGMNVNVWDVTDQIQALIRSGKPMDPARLTDHGIPLTDLL
jgi:3-phenylpropionate/trans-cinnamate dioxygenase ferredoxin reductase subunit